MGNLKVYHDNEPITIYSFTGYISGSRLYYNTNRNIIYIDASKLLNKELKITYSPVTANSSLRVFGAQELPSSGYKTITNISSTTSSYDSTTNTEVITVTNTNSLYKYLIIGIYKANAYPDTFAQNCGVTYANIGWDDNALFENYAIPDIVTPSFIQRGFYSYYSSSSGTTEYSITNGTGLYYIPASDTQGKKFLIVNGSDNTGFVFYTADFNGTYFYNFAQKIGSAGPTYDGKSTQIIGSTADKALIITRLDHTSGNNPRYSYYYSDVAPSAILVPSDNYPPEWKMNLIVHKFNGTSWD